MLPGPVRTVSAAITPIAAPGFAITSAALYVNGTKVLEVGRGGGGFSSKPMTLFGFGHNVVELVAMKAPNPKGVAHCNTSVQTRVAVQAFVRGEFTTDLALIDPKPEDQAFDASETASVVGQMNFSVRNKGPGGAARGLFHLTLILPSSPARAETTFTIDPVGDGPFEKERCSFASAGVGTYDAACYFSDFRPGASQLIRVLYRSAGARPGDADVSATANWNISLEGTDTDPSNNQRTVKLWFCGLDVAAGGTSCSARP